MRAEFSAAVNPYRIRIAVCYIHGKGHLRSHYIAYKRWHDCSPWEGDPHPTCFHDVDASDDARRSAVDEHIDLCVPPHRKRVEP